MMTSAKPSPPFIPLDGGKYQSFTHLKVTMAILVYEANNPSSHLNFQTLYVKLGAF